MPRPVPPSRPGAVVIDTNVLLDWLVFDDPRVAPLVVAVTQGDLQWIATAPMRAEFEAVLARRAGSGAGRPMAGEQARQAWDRHAKLCETRLAQPPAPRCRDADDQMFVELAAARRCWLLTRDKAILVLTARLQAHGAAAATPEAWAAGMTSCGSATSSPR